MLNKNTSFIVFILCLAISKSGETYLHTQHGSLSVTSNILELLNYVTITVKTGMLGGHCC